MRQHPTRPSSAAPPAPRSDLELGGSPAQAMAGFSVATHQALATAAHSQTRFSQDGGVLSHALVLQGITTLFALDTAALAASVHHVAGADDE
ncbi:RebB family R body protein [Pyxidicoccus parkwayensis]|uniref:RebB family R body protein n=1 Tax=Pyxidicoccus parkwayensis TaxID=2813578 RepID=A0ABX7NX49_9BACT|nr:RebB family R body protein [Pyxidicoccus parkwaysis]QSQ21961.1 RebB family R body protein [Pyxidicoccus parkwaysis]